MRQAPVVSTRVSILDRVAEHPVDVRIRQLIELEPEEEFHVTAHLLDCGAITLEGAQGLLRGPPRACLERWERVKAKLRGAQDVVALKGSQFQAELARIERALHLLRL